MQNLETEMSRANVFQAHGHFALKMLEDTQIPWIFIIFPIKMAIYGGSSAFSATQSILHRKKTRERWKVCQANETIGAVKDLKMKVAKVRCGKNSLVGSANHHLRISHDFTIEN